MNYQEPKLVSYTSLSPIEAGILVKVLFIPVAIVVAAVFVIVVAISEVIVESLHGDEPCG